MQLGRQVERHARDRKRVVARVAVVEANFEGEPTRVHLQPVGLRQPEPFGAQRSKHEASLRVIEDMFGSVSSSAAFIRSLG